MGKREHIYKIIAENIRKERRRLGITQAELAEQGIKPNTIRLSIGTENIDDIIYDLQEAFDSLDD